MEPAGVKWTRVYYGNCKTDRHLISAQTQPASRARDLPLGFLRMVKNFHRDSVRAGPGILVRFRMVDMQIEEFQRLQLSR